MLKQLTATGIAVAGIAGVMLFASPANAESLTVKHNGCYGYACHRHPGYYPGYHHGWRHWHHHRFYR